jgi:hypothetical protein
MLEDVSRTALRAVLVFTGCALGACANTKGGSPASPSAGNGTDKFDAEGAYARELQPLAKAPVQFEKLSGEAEAGGAPTVKDLGTSFEMTIPVGTESPLQCFVYKKEVDAGGTVLKVMREVGKSVDVRTFKVQDVSLIGDYPAVYLEAQYLAKTPKGQALGELKSMFYQHPVNPMLCMHDELGYNETFHRMTKGLAASLKIAGLQVAPTKLMEVYVDKIDGHPVGFSSHVVLPNKNGKRAAISRSTMFLPRSDKDLAIQDRASNEIWDPEGRLLEAVYADSDGGELSLAVTLKKVGPVEYAYKGKAGGKELAGKFKTKSKRGLATDKVLADLVAAELLSGKSNELTVEEYHASVNPEAALEVSYKTASKEKRQITTTIGDAQATLTSDEKGRLEKAEIPVGTTSITHERVFTRGAP